jgi:low affinity Fe/Cu permease
MTFRHPADRPGKGRGVFERLAEGASNFSSTPVFHGLCLALVAAFIAVKIAGVSLAWQLFVGELMTAVSLLLLALLKNSERRAEHAIQQKLNLLAAAMSAQDEGETNRAREDLRKVIGMEEEV